MSIKLKAGKLLSVQKALTDLIALADDSENNISVKLTYWAIRVKSKLEKEIQDYGTQRDKLLEKYAKRSYVQSPTDKDKDGKPMLVPSGNMQFTKNEDMVAFTDEMKKLDENDIELEGNVFPMKIEEFEECKKVWKIVDALNPILSYEDDAKIIEEIPQVKEFKEEKK